MARALTLSDLAREHLGAATIDGNSLSLPQIDHRATYAELKKVIERLGGTWVRAAKTHVFATDPSDALATVLESGIVPADARTLTGYIRTPADLAADLVRLHSDLTDLDPWPDGTPTRVLEPSAGDGRIVTAILTAAPGTEVWAVEPAPHRARACAAAARALVGDDRGLLVDAAHIPDPGTYPAGSVIIVTASLETFIRRICRAGAPGLRFDLAIMNPPFSIDGSADLWLDHVLTAWQLLHDGGHLVTIVPGSYTFRSTLRHKMMRLFTAANAGTTIELPTDTFEPEGAKTQSLILRIDRPARDAGPILAAHSRFTARP